jgi:hypothetical protein
MNATNLKRPLPGQEIVMKILQIFLFDYQICTSIEGLPSWQIMLLVCFEGGSIRERTQSLESDKPDLGSWYQEWLTGTHTSHLISLGHDILFCKITYSCFIGKDVGKPKWNTI